MTYTDPENPPKSSIAAALDLLSKCHSDLREFDNNGSYEEADLAHVVGRMRKVVAVLVPGAWLSSVLRNIDDALLISAEERRAEELLASVFSGPFLLSRARRLVRIAEGLRDDIALGRLGNTLAEPASSANQGEAPQLVKWAMWCWENRRKRTGWVILTLVVAAVWYLLDIYPRLHFMHP